MVTVEDVLAYMRTEPLPAGRFNRSESGDTVYGAGYVNPADDSITMMHFLHDREFFTEGNTIDEMTTESGETIGGAADAQARRHFEQLPNLIPDTDTLIAILFKATVAEHLDNHPSPRVVDVDAMDPAEPTQSYLKLSDIELLDQRTIDAQQARAESDIY